MRRRNQNRLRHTLLACLLLFNAAPGWARVDFIRDVKPILELRCVRCHGPDRAMRGLRLDRKERAMMAIVKKNPSESSMFAAMQSGYMPPGGKKLSDAEVETIRKWIMEGARWPKGVELEGKNPFVPAR